MIHSTPRRRIRSLEVFIMKGWKTVLSENFTTKVPHDYTVIALDKNVVEVQDPSGLFVMHFEHRPVKSKIQSDDTFNVPAEQIQAYHFMREWIKSFTSIRLTDDVRQVVGTRYQTLASSGVEKQHWLSAFKKFGVAKSPQRGYRFWLIRHEESALLVWVFGPTPTLDFTRVIQDGILNAVQLGKEVGLKNRPFIETVVELANEYVGTDAVAAVDEQTVTIGGVKIRVNHLHDTWMGQPENLAEDVRDFFDDLLVEYTGEIGENDGWPQIRTRVLPTLIPQAMLSALTPKKPVTDGSDSANPSSIIAEPWVNDLLITYQMGRSDRYITAADLVTWDVSLETLHEHALANLARSTRKLSMSGGHSDKYALFSFPADDVMNSSRMLLPLVQKNLRPHLGTTYYMAVPDRHVLLAFSSDDQATLSWLRHQVEIRFTNATEPLSDRLFMVTPDGIVGEERRPQQPPATST
jgi:hypothetical protein